VLLSAGTYRFVYDAVGPSGQPLPAIPFTLGGIGISDPIGPQPVDPTEDPQQAAAPPPDGTTPEKTSSDNSSPPPDSTPPTDTSDTTFTSTDGSSDPMWTYQNDSTGVQTADPSSKPAT